MLKKLQLWHKVLIGLVLGFIAGYVLGEDAAQLKWIGDLFINLIMMVIVPLVFFSIVSSIASLGDAGTLGRLGGKAFFGYILTTVIAITLALFMANLFQPGGGIDSTTVNDLLQQKSTIDYGKAAEAGRPSVVDILLGVVPNNAVKAMAERNILQVIFFAVFVGVALILLKHQTDKIHDVVHQGALVFYKIIEIVIQLAPYAVFALTAWIIGTLGFDVFLTLINLVVTVVTACLTQYALILIVGIMLIARLSPLPFLKKAVEFQILAFATSSSSATIPTTMRVVKEKMGVSDTSGSLIVPLGATVNMNGTAIYIAICAVFVAQLSGISLSIADYGMIVLTTTLMSIGTAAIPSASLVMMPVVFASVGLPVEAIGLILGVDRFLDMVRTTLNVTGDAAVAVIVDKSEQQLNETLYNKATP
jgi:Na+/H+-dicarboxylate symporter